MGMHKYISKIRTKSGKWRYIYKDAGKNDSRQNEMRREANLNRNEAFQWSDMKAKYLNRKNSSQGKGSFRHPDDIRNYYDSKRKHSNNYGQPGGRYGLRAPRKKNAMASGNPKNDTYANYSNATSGSYGRVKRIKKRLAEGGNNSPSTRLHSRKRNDGGNSTTVYKREKLEKNTPKRPRGSRKRNDSGKTAFVSKRKKVS